MFSFRILPEGFGRLKELKELVIIGCGALGFRRDFTELTKLSHLVMIDPGPARSLKFPKNLSAMQSLTDVHIQCKDIPVELGTLPNLQTLTLRRLDPGPRRNMKQIERVRFADWHHRPKYTRQNTLQSRIQPDQVLEGFQKQLRKQGKKCSGS